MSIISGIFIVLIFQKNDNSRQKIVVFYTLFSAFFSIKGRFYIKEEIVFSEEHKK